MGHSNMARLLGFGVLKRPLAQNMGRARQVLRHSPHNAGFVVGAETGLGLRAGIVRGHRFSCFRVAVISQHGPHRAGQRLPGRYRSPHSDRFVAG